MLKISLKSSFLEIHYDEKESQSVEMVRVHYEEEEDD